ncbi:hypothetical protein WDU94_013633 [Cyamophila willieti]
MLRLPNLVTVISFVFFGSFILFTIFFRSEDNFDDHEIRLIPTIQSFPVEPKLKENIMFIKTHKCGSSTVQNIILRYGLENQLEIVLPEKIYLGKNIKHFKSEMIPPNLRSVDGQYNILAHHARYDSVEMKKLFNPSDTLYLTILRDPASMFESMYNFYKLNLIYNNVTLDDILSAPNKFPMYKRLLSHRYPYRFGLNQMSFDLGMDESMFDDQEAITDFMTILAQDFDLVMITEHMEVSLILLADMMQWPLERVVYLNHIERKEREVRNLTEAEQSFLRDLNLADTLLYDYFLRILKQKVLDYGVDRMKRQVIKLISLNYQFKTSCVKQQNYNDYGGTISYQTKDDATSQCLHAAMSEVAFSDNLRRLQQEKLKGLRLIDSLMTSSQRSEIVGHNGSNCRSNCITKPSKESTPTSSSITRSIFFLKAHKCGSSTVQNILLRYGRENNLSFVLPSKGNYIGHPKRFSRDLIGEDLRTKDNKYNVFTHHSRYNPEEVKLAMKPDAAFVTILRDPGTLFESLYTYCRFERRYNISFEQFKSNPGQHSHLLDSRHGSRFGRNQMCFDLGLDENFFFVDKYVQELIDNIEKDFDLVMISEYMEVSLVLLADLMGWPLEQVVYLDSNVRQAKNKNKLTADEMKAMRALNQADTTLYKHFVEKFKRKVKDYGVDRMKQQVDKLIGLNHDLYHTCVEEENTRGYALTYSYKVKAGSSLLCYLASKQELGFTEQLRKEQMYKMTQLRNIELLMSEDNGTDVHHVPSLLLQDKH